MIVRALVDLDEDFYAEIGTFDLVSGQQEYNTPIEETSTPWGGGMIKLLRLEGTYDGTNWKVFNSINFREISNSTQSAAAISSQFSKSSPAYSFFDNNIFLLPIPDANQTGGGRLFYIKRPVEMTTGADVPELPTDFLDILSLGITVDVYENLKDSSSMKDSLSRFNGRLLEMKSQESGKDVQDAPRFVPAKINYK